MATYQVTAPDGATYEVTAPEGASEADVLNYVKQNAAGQPKTNTAYDTARQMMGVYAPLADIGAGAKQGWDALAQLAARSTGWQVPQTEAAMTPKPADDSLGASLGRGVGQSLWTLPVAGLKALAALPKIAQGAVLGGAAGVLEPVYEPKSNEDFWQQKRSQAGIGTATGAGTTVAASTLGRMLAPKTSEAVKTLIKEKVYPSPGQVMGGTAQRLEDSLTSVPLLGEVINSGKTRALDQYNVAIYNRVLAPLGQTYPKNGPIGNEGVAKVTAAVSDAYDALLPKLSASIDPTFARNVSNMRAMVQTGLPEQQAKQFENVLQKRVLNEFTPGGLMSGETIKDVESFLGKEASNYIHSSDGAQRSLGNAYRQLQAELRGMVTRSNPAQGRELQAINKAFANLAQLQTAGANIGAKEGRFTAAQFAKAVKASDKSVRDNAFAQGKVLNQDIAGAGKSVLSQTFPETGARLIPALTVGGLLHATGTLPLAGVASLAYTPLGQRLVADALTARTPGMIAAGQTLGKMSPYLAAPFAAGLLGP